MNTTVSVIIPTYNRADLLPRALDSVQAQTRAAQEIIVVDDGSSDGTATLIEQNYPGVHYIHQNNSGVAAARNCGIRQASGDWLAFLDSDDAWQPDKLAAQLADLSQRTERVAYTDEIWIRRGKRVNPMKKHAKADGWIYRQCLPLCIISPSSVLIHRSVFASIGVFDEALAACEDYDLWLRIAARFPVRFLPQALIVKYGGHGDQLSQRYWGMDRFRVYALEKMLTEAPLTPQDRQATLSMLLEKLHILGNGAAKRGHADKAARYLQQRARYAQTLSECGR